jgi:hypothetical protein
LRDRQKFPPWKPQPGAVAEEFGGALGGKFVLVESERHQIGIDQMPGRFADFWGKILSGQAHDFFRSPLAGRAVKTGAKRVDVKRLDVGGVDVVVRLRGAKMSLEDGVNSRCRQFVLELQIEFLGIASTG